MMVNHIFFVHAHLPLVSFPACSMILRAITVCSHIMLCFVQVKKIIKKKKRKKEKKKKKLETDIVRVACSYFSCTFKPNQIVLNKYGFCGRKATLHLNEFQPPMSLSEWTILMSGSYFLPFCLRCFHISDIRLLLQLSR